MNATVCATMAAQATIAAEEGAIDLARDTLLLVLAMQVRLQGALGVDVGAVAAGGKRAAALPLPARASAAAVCVAAGLESIAVTGSAQKGSTMTFTFGLGGVCGVWYSDAGRMTSEAILHSGTGVHVGRLGWRWDGNVHRNRRVAVRRSCCTQELTVGRVLVPATESSRKARHEAMAVAEQAAVHALTMLATHAALRVALDAADAASCKTRVRLIAQELKRVREDMVRRSAEIESELAAFPCGMDTPSGMVSAEGTGSGSLSPKGRLTLMDHLHQLRAAVLQKVGAPNIEKQEAQRKQKQERAVDRALGKGTLPGLDTDGRTPCAKTDSPATDMAVEIARTIATDSRARTMIVAELSLDCQAEDALDNKEAQRAFVAAKAAGRAASAAGRADESFDVDDSDLDPDSDDECAAPPHACTAVAPKKQKRPSPLNKSAVVADLGKQAKQVKTAHAARRHLVQHPADRPYIDRQTQPSPVPPRFEEAQAPDASKDEHGLSPLQRLAKKKAETAAEASRQHASVAGAMVDVVIDHVNNGLARHAKAPNAMPASWLPPINLPPLPEPAARHSEAFSGQMAAVLLHPQTEPAYPSPDVAETLLQVARLADWEWMRDGCAMDNADATAWMRDGTTRDRSAGAGASAGIDGSDGGAEVATSPPQLFYLQARNVLRLAAEYDATDEAQVKAEVLMEEAKLKGKATKAARDKQEAKLAAATATATAAAAAAAAAAGTEPTAASIAAFSRQAAALAADAERADAAVLDGLEERLAAAGWNQPVRVTDFTVCDADGDMQPLEAMGLPTMKTVTGQTGWTQKTSQKALPGEGGLKGQLEKLMTAVKSHPSAWPFHQPVDTNEVTDYLDVIADPIGKKLPPQILCLEMV